jgi:hypothetical protein
MRTAELLNAMAAWLASPNNEAMLLAEADEQCMQVVAESCVLAAELLKRAANEVDSIEPLSESLITPESIEETAALAAALDGSDDPQLKKMASVLDELLLSIAAPPNAYAERKDLQEQRAITLQKKYQEPREELNKYNKKSEVEKAIDNSGMTKEYRILEAPLSTRYCPDHGAGVQVQRIGEHMVMCSLDHKTYNYETGFTLNSGEKIPGGSVALQTDGLITPFHAIFDDRESRLNFHQ